MGETAKATAARIELTLAGRAWIVTPPTFRDFGEFEAWAEGDLLAQAAAANVADVHGIPRGPKASALLMNTTRGQARFAWIVTRRATPGLTPEAFAEAPLTLEDVAKIINAAFEAVATPNSGGKPGDAF